MAAADHEVRVKVVPELSEDMQALLGTATEETLEKVNAGAQLIYALYHHPKAKELLTGEFGTTSLTDAYMRATAAYGVGRSARASR